MLFVTAFALMGFTFFLNPQSLQAAGGSIPPWPVIYSGSVTLGGAPAPDGLWIVGRMDGYTSVPLEIKNGRMSGLAVGAPDQTFFGKTITFELRNDPSVLEGSTVADQTDVFAKYPLPTLKKDFDLTFPAFPTPIIFLGSLGPGDRSRPLPRDLPAQAWAQRPRPDPGKECSEECPNGILNGGRHVKAQISQKYFPNEAKIVPCDLAGTFWSNGLKHGHVFMEC